MLEFTIKTLDFLNFLQKATVATDVNKIMPITEYILLEILPNTNTLIATASDLENTLVTQVDVNNANDGSVVLHAKSFTIFIDKLSKSYKNIRVAVNANNQCSIYCGRTGEHVRSGLPKDKYLNIDTTFQNSNSPEIQGSDLLTAINLVLNCIADTGSVLSGAYIYTKDNTLFLVGTNSRKLCEVAIPLTTTYNLDAIIDKKTLTIIKNCLIKDKDGNITIHYDNSKLYFKINDTQIIANTKYGVYPDYKQYITLHRPYAIAFNKEELTNKVSIVQESADIEKSASVWDIKKNTVSIYTDHTGKHESTEVLDVNYNDAEFKIGLDTRIVLQILGSLKEEYLTLMFDSPVSPVLIKSIVNNLEVHSIIVPMRIN